MASTLWDDWLHLGWSRPLAFLALGLPLALLWWCRRTHRPLPWAIGTVALWKEVAAQERRDFRKESRRIPPAVWVACGALGAGVLALAGPHRQEARIPGHWTVVVDHSPSTSLPWAPGPGSPSRLEKALAAAFEVLVHRGQSGDLVHWRSNVRPDLELALGEEPPSSWLDPPVGHADEVRWELFDGERTLWVTDAASIEPQHAVLCASGGDAVPGPVLVEPDRVWDWDGEELRERARVGPPRTVSLEGRDSMPPALVDLFERWAQERGLALLEGDEAGALRLEAIEAEGPAVVARRDGWSWRGSAAGQRLRSAGEGDKRSEVWLWGDGVLPGGADRFPLVLARPGRIVVALRSDREPEGDRVGFALAWARLFDRCTLPPADVVPLGERRALEGAPRPDSGSLPASVASQPVREGYELGLAALAAALGALALSLLGRG